MSKPFLGVIFLLTININCCFGQAFQTFVDAGVDTSTTSIQAALKFYRSYLAEFSNGGKPDFKKYWPREDCEKYKCPDPTVYAVGSDYPTYMMGDKRTIFFVQPDKDYIIIKTLISNLDSLQNVSIVAGTDHYVQFDKDSNLHFLSPLKVIAHNWKTETVRNVTFHFAPSHTFNKKKADSLIAKIEMLEKKWGLPAKNITYYFTDTKEELGKLRGYDFRVGDGNREPARGMVAEPGLIFCAGRGEFYFHEVVHEYLNDLFPKSPLKEGLAVFYGGSMSHDLEWHIRRLKTYLHQHPEIDLNKPDDFNYMDDLTNPYSVIKGLLCCDAYKKDGVKGLKRIMSYDSLKEVMSNEYHAEAGSWNKVLRELIENSESSLP